MKIKYSPFVFIIFVVILGFLGNSFFNNEPSNNNSPNLKPVKSVKEIIAEKKLNSNFDNIKLFNFKISDEKNKNLNEHIKSFTLLNLNRENLKNLLYLQKENIVFEIPLSEKKSINLELTKIPVFSDKFEIKMITENGIVPYKYNPGIFYRGIIKDNPNSIATISIFENSVIGIISDEFGNYNLGVLKGDLSGENYIFYNDRDLYVKNNFKCDVDDFGKMRKNNYTRELYNIDNPTSRNPVRVYFVADYQMYLDFNFNISSVSNYISAVFNEVATIYQNEFLQVQISSIYVYTVPDPYRNLHNSVTILEKFGEITKDNFTGDLAHLLSTRDEGFGGIAWVNVLCENYNAFDNSGRFAFSGIESNYNPFPTYSWTVTVVAHEMGHNFGSMHTHACWWPISASRIGQIDSCVYINGESCSGTPNVPNYNGTLMSYCHLNGATNLYLGFGPMPGDTVRLRYNQCNRFGPVVNSSELPTFFKLDQNYPNPFNPVTTISFAVPQDAFISIKVYDVMGREIAELVNNKFYSRGYQNTIFNSVQYNLSSGIYFYKLIASNLAGSNIFTQVKKMILLK